VDRGREAKFYAWREVIENVGANRRRSEEGSTTGRFEEGAVAQKGKKQNPIPVTYSTRENTLKAGDQASVLVEFSARISNKGGSFLNVWEV
jgi:hypothetical protein